jgi:Flp pilus assembly pilin Flp
MKRIVRRLRRSEDGAVAIELAVVITLFLALVIGIVDFALLFYTWNSMQYASQQGARYAMINASSVPPAGCASAVYSPPSSIPPTQPSQWLGLCTINYVEQLVDTMFLPPVTVTTAPAGKGLGVTVTLNGNFSFIAGQFLNWGSTTANGIRLSSTSVAPDVAVP